MTVLKQPLSYFSKCAKSLERAVLKGDLDALGRVRKIFRDVSAENFALMRAQHVVAVEHGFKDWGELRQTGPAELYKAITQVKGSRRFDLPTQERVREILRLNRVDIPEDVLERPMHLLSIFPITGGASASLRVAEEIARENALRRPWGIDLGHFQGGLNEHQAARVKGMCNDEGIPFWEKRWTETYWMALKAPSALPREYSEIRETFGDPVPAVPEE